MRLLLIALGGAAGAVARYLVSGWVTTSNPTLPLGTLAVNASGSLVLGFFYAVALDRFAFPAELRFTVAVGFLGAYTTFSTFSYETFKLFESGAVLMAALNVILSIAAGLGALYFGVLAGRLL